MNIKDFVENVIGSTIYQHIYDKDPDQLQDYVHIIDYIEEKDDLSFDIVTSNNYKINVPSLETIEKILNGTPFIKHDFSDYRQIISNH